MDEQALNPIDGYFTYTNFSCSCHYIDDIDDNGDSIAYFKIKRDAATSIRYIYTGYQDSDSLSGLAKIVSLPASQSYKYIVQDILSMDLHDARQLTSFIETYGFLYPLSSDKYEKIKLGPLYAVLSRFKILASLIAESNSEQKDFFKLYALTMLLQFSPPITIKGDVMTSGIHTAYKYYYPEPGKELLSDNPNENMERHISVHFEDEILTEDSITQEIETITKEEYLSFMRSSSPEIVSPYASLSAKNELHSEPPESIYENPAPSIRNLAKAYCYAREDKETVRPLLDLMWHMRDCEHQIVSISTPGYICVNNGSFNRYYHFESLPPLDFPSKYEDILLRIVRQTITDELNYYMKGIHPTLNSDSLTTSWEIPDLLTALYYSLFFDLYNHQIYRVCLHPKCNNAFKVFSTNSRKRFCSKKCERSYQGILYRKKTKEI